MRRRSARATSPSSTCPVQPAGRWRPSTRVPEVSRALLSLRPGDAARLTGVRIPGDEGAGALISSFARHVVTHLSDYGGPDGARLGMSIVDVLAAALAARLDRADPVPPDSRQRALDELVDRDSPAASPTSA